MKYSKRSTNGRKRSKRSLRNRKGVATTRRLVNRDKLNMADQKKVGSAMVEVFDKLQQKPREVQLLALAGAFILMSETLGFPTNDTYSAVVNLWKDPMTSSGKGLQWDAMAYHLKTELDGQPE